MSSGLQFIPARGRKLRSAVCPHQSATITIYPRKGTETSGFRQGKDCRYYNLSPQGDGNQPAGQGRGCQPQLQFIPARGRKRGHNHIAAVNLKLQFIPARGRKPICSVRFGACKRLQFIPARGQKSTSATGVCQQRRCFAFSYILFYRLGTAPAGIVFVTGSALTPCGTSGFMGRISCR